MKLLVCVINYDDLYALTDSLTQEGYDSTVIGSTGGFLREGNATLLIGIPEDKVAAVLGIIKANCRTRVKYITPLPLMAGYEEAYVAAPIEVQVGGAVVFTLDVTQFDRF